MPVSQNEYLWSGATPILLISPARFFVYKGPKIDYFLSTPLDYRLLFVLVSACYCAKLFSSPSRGTTSPPTGRILGEDLTHARLVSNESKLTN